MGVPGQVASFVGGVERGATDLLPSQRLLLGPPSYSCASAHNPNHSHQPHTRCYERAAASWRRIVDTTGARAAYTPLAAAPGLAYAYTPCRFDRGSFTPNIILALSTSLIMPYKQIKRREVCRNFLKGGCPRGNTCHRKHVGHLRSSKVALSPHHVHV